MKSTQNSTDLTEQQMLAIQAEVDGQLESQQRFEVQALIAANGAAGVFRDSIAGTRAVIRRGEPTRVVPGNRDFYWSKIRRQIESAGRTDESAEKMKSVTAPDGRGALWSRWIGWGLPALGAAAVVLVMMRSDDRTDAENVALIEGSQLEASGQVFRSEHDGVTIHWIN